MSEDAKVCPAEGYGGRHNYIGYRVHEGHLEAFCYQCAAWLPAFGQSPDDETG